MVYQYLSFTFRVAETVTQLYLNCKLIATSENFADYRVRRAN